MARKKVVVTPMFRYTRELKKSPGTFSEGTKRVPKNSAGRFGAVAIRKETTQATSPKLLGYRACIAGLMTGKDFENLADVQQAFYKATQQCKSKK